MSLRRGELFHLFQFFAIYADFDVSFFLHFCIFSSPLFFFQVNWSSFHILPMLHSGCPLSFVDRRCYTCYHCLIVSKPHKPYQAPNFFLPDFWARYGFSGPSPLTESILVFSYIVDCRYLWFNSFCQDIEKDLWHMHNQSVLWSLIAALCGIWLLFQWHHHCSQKIIWPSSGFVDLLTYFC